MGLARLDQSTVQRAVRNYEELKESVDYAMTFKRSEAQKAFKPTFWQKLTGVRSLYKQYLQEDGGYHKVFNHYYSYLLNQGLITLTAKERKTLNTIYNLGIMKYEIWKNEYQSLNDMSDSDYIMANSQCCSFVRTFEGVFK